MKEFKYIIKDEVGIHARPAGLLVKEAKQFTSAITLTCNGKSTDAKKLFGIMGLAVKTGNEVTICCDGADEVECANSLEKFFTENL